MSYPHNFDPNQYDGMSTSYNNTPQQYQSGYQSLQQQQFSQIPAPIRSNQSINQTNMVLPDFSIPPPNFIQQQSQQQQQQQYVSSSNDLQYKQNVQRHHHRNQHQYNRSEHKRNFNELKPWYEPTTSSHQNNKFHHSSFKERSQQKQYDRHSERDRDSRYKNSSRYSSSYSKHDDSRSRSEQRSTNNGKDKDNRKSIERKPRSLSRKRTKSPPAQSQSQQHQNDSEQRNNVDKRIVRDDDRSERARILEKWRSNFCETSEDITRKLEELAEDSEKECWIRSSPADLFYKRTSLNEMEGTSRLEALCSIFKTELIDRGSRARESKPLVEIQQKKKRQRICRHKSKFISILANSIENYEPKFILCFQFCR